MLKILTGIALASTLIVPAYAIDDQMILQQLETLGKHKLAFPLAYQLAQKQDNYEVWHNLAKQYNELDTQFAAYLQAWKKAEQINTQETYEKFLELRPDSMFNLMPIHRIFELVKAKNSIEDYAKFIEKFGEKFPIAIEFIAAFNKIQELSFEKAKQVNTVEIFDDFIKTFPDAPQTKEAIEISFNLAKTRIEKEIDSNPEKLEKTADKLYGEARRIQDESGCQPKQYQTKECKRELFLPALRNYTLLKLPLFDSTASAIKMRDREEKIAFENALLDQQKRIENSIHEMKDAVVNTLVEQNQLLGKIVEGQQELVKGQQDLKMMFKQHHNIIEERLKQLNQIKIDLSGLNFNISNDTLNFKHSNPQTSELSSTKTALQNNDLLSTIVSTVFDVATNFIPGSFVIKKLIRYTPQIYRFAKRFI